MANWERKSAQPGLGVHRGKSELDYQTIGHPDYAKGKKGQTQGLPLS